jgi:mRNA interferase RelE/StbE
VKIIFDGAASKTLKRMPGDQAHRLLAAIEQLPAGDLKKLQGRTDHRLRVGDWRVIFEMTSRAIRIKAIGSRGDIYKR